jgi:asparagine synthase (glutamine-hydrolysing)
MCGIAGFVTVGTIAHPELEARLWAMIATLRHRGPDDEGVWTDGCAGLAHSRLSIIDVSPAAHQPMASADGSVWITYNGEVYNFAEIRRDLEALGYRFRSRSDTETIVNGWHAWGAKIFQRLRGMFALALWDQRTRRLILVRDRVGEKPLYWARTRSGILFGSEIKALLAWPGMARSANLEAIDHYLTLQYVPAPQTAFAGIRKLPPAHYLVVEPDAGRGIEEPLPVRYWQLPEPRRAAALARPGELRRELLARLEEVVRLRLLSDVPLGAFLSGGVDSSAVVAMMARSGGARVKTFSIGFAAKEYDETRYARIVAERYGTDHEEHIVEPDAAGVLPRLVWHYGEPFADPSAVPTWYVAELARRKVTVALTGDGGDECFLGYPRYRAMRYLDRLDRLPASSREGLGRLLSLVPPRLRRSFKTERVQAALLASRSHPAERYAPTIAFFAQSDKEAGYDEAMLGRGGGWVLDRLEPYFRMAPNLVTGANMADIGTYLPDDLLVKVDVGGMAHGLEARAPLLDHKLMEWATALPDAVKMRGGVTKALFKSALTPYLPRQIVYRPKRGFVCPIDRWFRGALKDLAYDTLLAQSARQRGLFQPDYVRRLLDQHCRRQADHHNRLWALLMLELWFRMWIDGEADATVLRPAA